MSTRGDILRRAAQVEPGAVPEPWRPSDDEDALATVSDREHYRKNLVTLPDGAGEVPAYVWDFPRTPTIPDEVREEWTRSSAGRVLNAQGQFVSRGSDVPRLSFDGDEAGLLVEAAGRTNQLTYSSNFTGADWDNNSDGLTAKSSILKGQTAQEIATSSDTDNINNSGAGVFSSRLESYSIIIEYTGSQDAVTRISIFSDVNDRVAYGEYLWGTDSTLLSIGDSVDKRVLTQNGPNGGKVVRFILRYDPSTDAEGGNGRQVLLFPDRSGNNEAVIFHHAQIEEAPNASSPIVTQGSPVTRSGDDYAIFEGGQPPWWNPNEGTIFLELVPRFYKRSNGFRLVGDDGDRDYIGYGKEPIGIFTADVSGNDVSTVNSIDPFKTAKIAVSFDANDIRQSVNGTFANAGAHDGTLLDTTTLNLSSEADATLIDTFTYVPRALSESTLNRITA